MSLVLPPVRSWRVSATRMDRCRVDDGAVPSPTDRRIALALFPVVIPSENGNRWVATGTSESLKALFRGPIRRPRAGQERPFCHLAKVGVAGSNPVVRSKIAPRPASPLEAESHPPWDSSYVRPIP